VTEHIDLAELRRLVPSYSRDEELLRWQRNGPAGERLARRSGPRPEHVLRYADHTDGVIDVLLPAGPPAPTGLTFLVHGGSFRHTWDRGYLRHLGRRLTRHGLVVALPEFRRVGGGGGWPTIALDVTHALKVVRAELARTAPGWIDPVRPVVVVGHSSGGHLGAWAALRSGPATVSRIVAVAPSFALRFNARIRKHNGYIQDLLGGEPQEVPWAYEEADIARLAGGAVPMTIVQGMQDLQLTVEASRRAARCLAGVAGVTYVEVGNADHFDLVDPDATVCTDVLVPLVSGGFPP
jgi:acetyl esterase/lipase